METSVSRTYAVSRVHEGSTFYPERASQEDVVKWVKEGGHDFVATLSGAYGDNLVISHGVHQTELKRPVGIDDRLMRERIEDFREGRRDDMSKGDRRFFRPVLLWWLMVARNQDPELLVRQERHFSALPTRRDPLVDSVRKIHLRVSQQELLNDGTEDNEADLGRDWRNETLSMSEKFIRDWCVCMEESLPMRDAILISSVSDMDYLDLMSVACSPTDPHVKKKEDAQLQRIFCDPTWEKKYGGTCLLAIDALIGILQHVDGTMSTQPCAMLAYLLWWAGRGDESLAAALRALSIDRTCSLAQLVVKVCRRNVRPTWCEKGNEKE